VGRLPVPRDESRRPIVLTVGLFTSSLCVVGLILLWLGYAGARYPALPSSPFRHDRAVDEADGAEIENDRERAERALDEVRRDLTATLPDVA